MPKKQWLEECRRFLIKCLQWYINNVCLYKLKYIWGYAGGSNYDRSGAAVNPLCLPRDPEWGVYTDGTEGEKAYVFGMEYETATSPGILRSLYQQDVPCAVCLLRNKSVVKMFPGEINCDLNFILF